MKDVVLEVGRVEVWQTGCRCLLQESVALPFWIRVSSPLVAVAAVAAAAAAASFE